MGIRRSTDLAEGSPWQNPYMERLISSIRRECPGPSAEAARTLFRDLGVKDIGTPESAETVAELRRFEKEYFGNGQLHIVDADIRAT
jgi:hypothetical protein